MADIREFKTAAKAAAEYLSRDGIEVSQSKMLEALARGFGGRNWVAFRESIAGLMLPGKEDPYSELASTLEQLIRALEAEDFQLHDGFPGAQARSSVQGNEKTRALFGAFIAHNRAKQAEQSANLVSQDPDLAENRDTQTVSGRMSSSPRREAAKAQGRVWLDILKDVRRMQPPLSTGEQVKQETLATQMATLKAFLGPILCPHYPLEELWESVMAEKALSSVLLRYGTDARLAHVYAFLKEEANPRLQSGVEPDNTAASLQVVASQMASHLAPYVTNRDSVWYDRPLVQSATGSDEAASANSTEAGKRRRLDFSNVPPGEHDLLILTLKRRPACYPVMVNYATGEIRPVDKLPELKSGKPPIYQLSITTASDKETRYSLQYDKERGVLQFQRPLDFERFQKAYSWLINVSDVPKVRVKIPESVSGVLLIRRADRTEQAFSATLNLGTGALTDIGSGSAFNAGLDEWEKFIYEDDDGGEHFFYVHRERADRYVYAESLRDLKELIASGRG
jgi:hypothetical protein